ncbi:hypothetical protein LJC57_06870 [Parabacteroides sp. OttesenSCG-928-G07]|nr:hypothetical protein [Parabacteroides sp. OttesenSCG-928-G07]
MKKVILMAVITILCIHTASAQFEKGSKTLSANVTGLNLGFTSVKDADDTQIDFNIMAKGSYFIIDNLAITAGLGYAYEKIGNYKNHLFQFEAGGRYYLYQGLYGALAYVGTKMKDVDLISFGKIEVGYDFYISENVFFEPAIYLEKGFGDTAKDVTRYGLAVGIGVNF